MRRRRLSRNSPRVWQLTNKRVSTRMARRSHFPSLITITIASKRSDGVSPRLLRSPTTMSTATRHRKCESSVMGNWSEQTRTGGLCEMRRCHRFVISSYLFPLLCVPQMILRDAYLKFRCREPEGKGTRTRARRQFSTCSRRSRYLYILSCNACSAFTYTR